MKAIVTGGVKGLGFSFTKELLNRGYEVYALYNTSKSIADNLNIENLTCIECDITDEQKVKSTLKNIGKVDLLINNAGIAIDNEYKDKSKEEFLKVLEVNVVGTFLVTKYVELNDNSVVINISSNNALDNYSVYSMDYDASKAGVNMLTKDFALALPYTKVVSICPGWINTEEVRKMNPNFLKEEMKKVNQNKIIEPAELVKVILNNINSYENGSIIEIKEV